MGLTDLRIKLAASANTKFQRMVERDDLINELRTQDKLIQCLWQITRTWPVMFTAVVSDHSDDRAEGPHCHRNGYCADLWPIYITNGTWEYVDAGTHNFRLFLQCVKNAPNIYEIGLGGSAYTQQNMLAASGGRCNDIFEDSNQDHVHIGVA